MSATRDRFHIPDCISERATSTPDRVLLEEIGGRTLTYAEVYDSALRWAILLERRGVRAGDAVAVMLPTSAAAYVVWLGVAWLGAHEISISAAFRGAMLERALAGSGARILVTTADQLATVREIGRPTLETIMLLGPGGHDVAGIEVVDAEAELTPQPPWRPAPREWQVSSVILTSGTTGPSKGVVTPWGVFNELVNSVIPEDDQYADGAFYEAWPIHHLSGKGIFARCVAAGLRVVIRRTFSASSFWDEIRTHRCTHAVLPGTAGALWNRPPEENDASSPLRKVLMVPLIPQYEEFEARFGVEVSTLWGMTEAGLPLCAARPANARTSGRSAPGFELRLVDEHDQEVPTGSVGEMIVRHERPWTMNTGYLGQPDATAKAWTNGWFHTQDQFVRDEAGDFYFVDRLTDSIRRRGENVSSLDIENEVLKHPEVVDCACVGVRLHSALSGTEDSEIRVIAVRGTGSALTASELSQYLAPRLPNFMLPRYIEFVDDLERNAMSRVDKARLRKRPLTSATWDRNDA